MFTERNFLHVLTFGLLSFQSTLKEGLLFGLCSQHAQMSRLKGSGQDAGISNRFLCRTLSSTYEKKQTNKQTNKKQNKTKQKKKQCEK